jgi:septum formation protein
MSEVTRRLVLASASPRRRKLLEEAGFDFDVHVPRIREVLLARESPDFMAQRLAREKAQSIAASYDSDSCVLGADTAVVLDSSLLGKPRDGMEAVEMLTRLSGRTHSVLTGYALVVPGSDRIVAGVVESRVRMRSISNDEAHSYVATGEPLDKAGSYALQGIGAKFVEALEGSRSNVIGLPLEAVVPRLESLGVVRTCRT